MGFRENFRSSADWLESTQGQINLNSPSNGACKLFDAAVTQFLGWYEDQQLGGLQRTVAKMLEEDPNFVMGRALDAGLELIGALSTTRLDPALQDKVEKLNKCVKDNEASNSNRGVTQWERLHVEVVNQWAGGHLKEATRVLERITTLYPQDVYALKLNQDTYFYLGASQAMRSSLAGAIGKITASNPWLGYAHGMYAFGLEESGQYSQAQDEARKAIELNPNDTWAIHNYAHCQLMQGLSQEGLKWMLDNKCNWLPCSGLACHQYWHTALFHIDLAHYDEAIELLDDQILTRCLASSSGLDLHDAASMLYRMELVDLFAKTPNARAPDAARAGTGPNRWRGVYEMCEPHKLDHIVGFNDAHYMMSYLAMDDLVSANQLIGSLTARQAPALVERDAVVKPLLEAMLAYKQGRYRDTVDKMWPIRHDIVKIGGSHAQRDVFEQLLMVAALKSGSADNRQLVDRMARERDQTHARRAHQTELLLGS